MLFLNYLTLFERHMDLIYITGMYYKMLTAKYEGHLSFIYIIHEIILTSIVYKRIILVFLYAILSFAKLLHFSCCV